MAINNDLLYWNNGKAVITDLNEDILNLTHWNNGKSFGNLIYREISKTDNQISGKIIITNNPISILDGKINIIDQILSNLDGKIILRGIKIDRIDILDGRIEIIDVIPPEIDIKWESGEPNINIRDFRFLNLTYWKNGVQVGDLLYQTNETGVEYSLMNGRLNLKDSEIFNLDSKLIINFPIEINNLFGGKVSPQIIPVGIVKIKIF